MTTEGVKEMPDTRFWRRRREDQHLELAAEVRQCPLRSGQMESGSACCDLELARRRREVKAEAAGSGHGRGRGSGCDAKEMVSEAQDFEETTIAEDEPSEATSDAADDASSDAKAVLQAAEPAQGCLETMLRAGAPVNVANRTTGNTALAEAVKVGSEVPGFYFLARNWENLDHFREELRTAVTKAMNADVDQLHRMADEASSCTFPLDAWQRRLLRAYQMVLVQARTSAGAARHGSEDTKSFRPELHHKSQATS
eukprot:s2125_g10.t1